MSGRWKERDDELACVWLMTLDDLAEHLGRTDVEVLRRLRELGVLPARGPAAASLKPYDAGPPLEAGFLENVAEHDRCPSAMSAMSAEEAEAVARRVMLHLYRGSIDLARQALEGGWREHVGEQQPLPTGPELLAEPLARVLSGVRLLNMLDQAGITTVGQLLRTSQTELLRIDNLGRGYLQTLHDECGRLRVRAGLPPECERTERGRSSRERRQFARLLAKQELIT